MSGAVALRDTCCRFARRGAPVYTAARSASLVNARGVIDALAAGRIDVGPLDSYGHDLIRHNDPAFAAKVRIVAVTEAAPMPPLIATAALDPDVVGRLRKAFAAVEHASELEKVRETLLLRRFAVPEASAYDVFHGILEASERHAGVW